MVSQIGGQIKIARREAGLDVVGKGRGKAGVDVIRDGNAVDGDEVGPSVAGQVEGWRT